MEGKEYEPKVGDRIRWHPRSSGYYTRNHYGTITKIGASGYVTSTIDGSDKTQLHRPSKYGRRYHFDKLSEHEMAVAQWKKDRPKHDMISAGESYYSDRIAVQVHNRSEWNAATLRELSAAALMFAEWLDKEPKKPGAEDDDE